MLTGAQALTIARRSIKVVTGINVGNIDADHTLERSGVTDGEGLRLVKRLACQSVEFGVPKYGHVLLFEDLDDITIGSTVLEFALKIAEQAESA